MKRTFTIIVGMAALLLALDSAYAQTGAPYIHDPSTIAECDGKYYKDLFHTCFIMYYLMPAEKTPACATT